MFIYIGFHYGVEFFTVLFIIVLRISLLSLVKKPSTIHCIPDFLTLKNFIVHVFVPLGRYSLPYDWPRLWVDLRIFIIANIELICIYIFIYLILVLVPSWFCCVIQLCGKFNLVGIFMEGTFGAYLLIANNSAIPHVFAIFRLLHILVLYFMVLVRLMFSSSRRSSLFFLLGERGPSTLQAVSLLIL